MSDLISRSAVIELLRKNMTSDIQDQITTENNINLIESLPTAFDTEKVVAELEEATKYVTIDGKSTGLKALHPIQAINIVKRGGVE